MAQPLPLWTGLRQVGEDTSIQAGVLSVITHPVIRSFAQEAPSAALRLRQQTLVLQELLRHGGNLRRIAADLCDQRGLRVRRQVWRQLVERARYLRPLLQRLTSP